MGLRIFNPNRAVLCENCAQYEPGVFIRRVTDVKSPIAVCGRCLAMALQEVTKQNWVSQFTLWQANSKLGKEIQERKEREQY